VLGAPVIEPLRPSEPVAAPPVAAPAAPPAAAARSAERVVPAVPWLRVMIASALCLLVLMIGWETQMRRLGLRAGDLDDTREAWAAERRKVDAGPRDAVVIIGDSRMLFDTDLATWQSLTGRKPIQLAMPAVNAQPFLHDLANDEHFAGLLVIGTAEISYFRDGDGGALDVLQYVQSQTPTQRLGYALQKALSRRFAFLDSNYTLFNLIERHHWAERNEVYGPYDDVWKLSESFDDRQTHFWPRLERDPALLAHARHVWQLVYRSTPVPKEVVDRTIAKTRADIERIRARGGDVVWVRPPSSGPILEREHSRYPRALVWDRLLRETGCIGVNFEDYPQMQHYVIPDWSHLAQGSAVPFTTAYVQALLQHSTWLRAHPAVAAPAS
jgi:hypothetical protein